MGILITILQERISSLPSFATIDQANLRYFPTVSFFLGGVPFLELTYPDLRNEYRTKGPTLKGLSKVPPLQKR